MDDPWRKEIHRTADCTGISDGHKKAASDGKPNYPARQYELAELKEEFQRRESESRGEEDGVSGEPIGPCIVCWGQSFRADRWLRQRLKVELLADSVYEIGFYDGVLSHVRGLDPGDVQFQHWAQGASKRHRVDFAIVRAGHQQIAIEIDGLHKTPDSSELDARRQSEWSARQNDLVGADSLGRRLQAPGACDLRPNGPGSLDWAAPSSLVA